MSRYNLRLVKIDETQLHDHYHITDSDSCYYMIEYHGNEGLDDEGFSLIQNIKKSISLSGQPQYQYKRQAIREVANIIADMPFSAPEKTIFIPAPTSKKQQHPEYDDRLIKTLEQANAKRLRNGMSPFQISECIETTVNRNPQHLSGDNRRSKDELKETMRIRPGSNIPSDIQHIIIFDDVITAGTTFKCCQEILKDYDPSIPCKVVGLFIARRVPENSFSDIVDFDELFD